MCLGRPDCQGEVGRFIALNMSDAERKARLAEQLRANLRKRKAQAREAAAGEDAPPSADDSPSRSPK